MRISDFIVNLATATDALQGGTG